MRPKWNKSFPSDFFPRSFKRISSNYAPLSRNKYFSHRVRFSSSSCSSSGSCRLSGYIHSDKPRHKRTYAGNPRHTQTFPGASGCVWVRPCASGRWAVAVIVVVGGGGEWSGVPGRWSEDTDGVWGRFLIYSARAFCPNSKNLQQAFSANFRANNPRFLANSGEKWREMRRDIVKNGGKWREPSGKCAET